MSILGHREKHSEALWCTESHSEALDCTESCSEEHKKAFGVHGVQRRALRGPRAAQNGTERLLGNKEWHWEIPECTRRHLEAQKSH